MKPCINNNWVNYGSAIAIQVLFVFIFLSIFFFVYVVKVERDTFILQINELVDNIMKDISDDMYELLTKQIDKETVILIITGTIAMAKQKIQLANDSENNKIKKNNKRIFNNSIIVIMITTCAVFLLALCFLIIGFCIPVQEHIVESLYIIVFIACTEFIFLSFIAKQYKAINANQVRKYFADSIQNYISNRPK